ncbi:Epimerase family protein [Arenibacter antarcticus]|uniref:TIGR01777 family oxidoreductase n=1 Tax=Arenibacter antarcticus TaxID=2040469 RepID=A0ABW5VMB8_9FLAO|nr:TIGR01777 family oxidoreductase [Arenibacter sp. H213]MCM4168717.1 TIGR01777 family protein [Arenibacter sp. H213]
MKILITGATGLVGTEIAKLCRDQEISVNYLTTQRDKIISKEGYTGYYWNPAKNEIDSDCFKGVSAIINLAGASIAQRWTKNNKKKILSSRLDSLRTLATALGNLDDHDIDVIVSASAIGIYPDSPSNYFREDEQRVDDSFLGEVTRLWEEEVDKFEKLNIGVAKVRIGLVMSSEGGALPKMAKPIQYYLGAAIGSGKQWQSWIHVQDLANIFLHIIESGLTGVYNGVGPNPVSNDKLTKEIAKVLDKPLFLPNIPRVAMQLILGEMSYLLFASQRVSSKKIEATGYSFIHSNICRALGEIYNEKQNCGPDSAYQEKFVS